MCDPADINVWIFLPLLSSEYDECHVQGVRPEASLYRNNEIMALKDLV